MLHCLHLCSLRPGVGVALHREFQITWSQSRPLFDPTCSMADDRCQELQRSSLILVPAASRPFCTNSLPFCWAAASALTGLGFCPPPFSRSRAWGVSSAHQQHGGDHHRCTGLLFHREPNGDLLSAEHAGRCHLSRYGAWPGPCYRPPHFMLAGTLTTF